MAIAPTQNRTEAFINPSVKRLLPPPFISLRWSAPPTESSRSSMRRASPRMVPTTMQTMTHRAFCVPTAEETPMPSTHRPSAWVTMLEKRGGMKFLNSSPMRLPSRMSPALMNVAGMARFLLSLHSCGGGFTGLYDTTFSLPL